jgi:hypothetical protein
MIVLNENLRKYYVNVSYDFYLIVSGYVSSTERKGKIIYFSFLLGNFDTSGKQFTGKNFIHATSLIAMQFCLLLVRFSS